MNITITDKAKEELIKLGVGETNKFLRVAVVPGGCSGMKYDAYVDELSGDCDDTVYNEDEICIVSDEQSTPHLDGLTIDYSDDLVQSGFKFINPNNKKGCGCGGSFEI